jgi:hypothetical protein
VQANNIRMGFDGNNCEGYIHMGAGGVLAVLGDKTTDPFLPNGMFTKGPGTAIGEIQYLNGSTWENMTGAAASLYTLEYVESETFINGQDVDGYTVLTMLDGTPPAASTAAITSITWGSPDATIEMTGVDGTTYTCDSSPDLVNWTLGVTTDPVSLVPGASGVLTFTTAAGAVKKFYRIAE